MWPEIQVDVMRRVLMAKFSDAYLQQQLLDTGDEELIEHNTWKDRFWGVWEGRGENQLGQLLMEVRAHYRNIRSRQDAARVSGWT